MTSALMNIMNLAVAINNKNAANAEIAISNLSGVQLSDTQKASMLSYEESLVNLATDDSSLVDFLKSGIFDNQEIFDAKYVYAIAEITSSVGSTVLEQYLDSTLAFTNPFKQYRYCFVLSNKAIQSGKTVDIEKAINKMHDFTVSQPDFVAPSYSL